MLWFAVALMTLAALALLAWPFVVRRRAPAPRDAYDLTVYRDQLLELDNDVARGVISAAEAEGARLEIQRRMLRLAPGAPTPITVPDAPPRRWTLGRVLPLGALGLALPAAAIALYVSIGSPNLPSRPFAETRHAADLQGQSIEAAVTKLKERLEREPSDLNGWIMLGRSLVVLNRHGEAVAALKRAAALSGDKPEIIAALAEAMVFEAQGVVPPEARQLFETVRETNPKDSAALYYIGVAEAQGGDSKSALATWEILAAETAADAPWRDDLVMQMKQAANELGVEPMALPPVPEPKTATADGSGASAAPGPSAADMADAASMSPEDQQAIIRSMVERLATRLESEPDDLEAWRRLTNAYRVLGEAGKMKDAEANIARLEAKGGASKPAEPDASAPRGPSESDIAAAADMSSEERTAMIRTMVGQLAARLETEPDNLEGWKRLAFSYRVLGELDKAVPAFKRAAELAPEDAGAQAEYARAVLDAAPSRERVPDEAIRLYRRVLELNPEHPDALWFVGYAEATASPPDKAAARGHWQKLLSLLPPGSEPFQSVENALKAL